MGAFVHRSRPALGEEVPLGTLYDARTDRFLPQSLLKRGYNLSPEEVSVTRPKNPPEISSVIENSYQAKFDLLNVDSNLASSILGKFLKLGGVGAYHDDDRQRDNMLFAAVCHRITCVQEKFHFMRTQHQTSIDDEVLRNQEATHFVSGIDWGIQTIVSIKHALSSLDTRSAVEPQFQAQIERFKSAIEAIQPANEKDPSLHQSTNMSMEITTYSDVFTNEGILMKNLDEACHQIRLIPLHIEQEYSNKGQAMMYTLLPINVLGILMEVEGSLGATMTTIGLETERRFIQLFDQFDWSQQALNDYYAYASHNHQYCAKRHLQEVESKIAKMQISRQSFEKQFAEALYKVRSGESPTDLLDQIYTEFASGNNSPTNMASMIGGQLTKTRFVVSASQQGATYIDSMDLLASSIRDTDAYVLSLSEATMKDAKHWADNVGLFRDLLNSRKPNTLYIIVDYDTGEHCLPHSRVSYYEKGREVSEDVLEQQSWEKKQCFVRYKASSLETENVQRPLKRRFVTMPCPSPNCYRERVCEWICFECHAPIEFGFTDQYIYCDCGRSLYENFGFKCNQSSHEREFWCHHNQRVLSQLKNLGDSDNVNILILGETGVGKSTFINAFVNYLTFETLDDAKAEEHLNWVIPCSFSTQIIDKNRADGKIEQIEIKVGAREDERDGSKGASATQLTAVYPVTIGNRTIRLIDTPGIGDTRGLHYDKQNMADILSTLSNYDDLHGILILLKSNNSRLTVTFNFCMKELLTHLHRSATNNMAFGFTNTRISNYLPGDTFGPLETIMTDHSDVGLSLTRHTIYCFDSESFRYLAAFKNGTIMDNEEDFRRSWQHSRNEVLRLVEYFKSKTPHKVQSTISLNGARQLIANLTKPMAEISALIKTNIAMSEDKIEEMKDTRITGDNLKMRLHLQKIHLRSKQLDKPRTVCKDKDCIEFKDNGGGEVVTIYKTHCHPVCYLDNVKADQVAHPGLLGCAAFNGQNYCNRCKHHWQSHLHVLYELEEYMATVTDTEVQRQLQANANDVTLREAAIKDLDTLIAEYKDEHETIQTAAARFGVFLKKYSITPYNDATLEYLDMLIRDEEAKVQVGGNRKRLEDLVEDRRKHEELVKVLTRNMDNKFHTQYQVLNEAGVERLVDQLYHLKHFGKNLKSVKNTISTAYEATNRERPYRVQYGGTPRHHRQPQGSHHFSPTSIIGSSLTTRSRRGRGTVVENFLTGWTTIFASGRQ